MSDDVIDILAEIQNQPNQFNLTSLQDRQPLLKKLTARYFESGLCAVLEEISCISDETLKKSLIFFKQFFLFSFKVFLIFIFLIH